MSDIRETLRRGVGEFSPRPDGYERVLQRRDRRRRNQRIVAGALAIAIVVVGALAFLESLRSPPPPMDDGTVPGNTRPVFQRTATVGSFTVTSPSDWFLVDYWGAFNPDDPTALDAAKPVLELTNFDPGLSTPVCEAGPGDPMRLPAAGIAILVTVGGDDGADGSDLCGGNVDESATGAIGAYPYRSLMTVGPDATEEDRVAAMEVWRSIETINFTFYTRGQPPAYVLDGWVNGGLNWLIEARRSKRSVELYAIAGGGTYESAEFDPRRSTPIQGQTVGFVTEGAAQIEYHRAGVAAALAGTLLDLPPSLASGVDAYVFEQQPTGGPSEVLAFGADGTSLGSNLPPLVGAEQVGTVDAFGTSWIVKRSTTEDGGWGDATCVEPAATGSPSTPCARGWGGGMLVQGFEGPSPAVFVTQSVGDLVGAIDVRADDGRVFHAVMLPSGRGMVVAVVALEGEGRGRFVYSLTDGGTDQGRRPEAHVEWPDLGQVIGDGTFPPPDEP